MTRVAQPLQRLDDSACRSGLVGRDERSELRRREWGRADHAALDPPYRNGKSRVSGESNVIHFIDRFDR